MFDDLELFDNYVEKFPIGIKMKFVFYELPYWEHTKITHLLDPIHIFKNVSSSLWRHISLKESVTLTVRRDLISSKKKKTLAKIRNYRSGWSLLVSQRR